MTYRQFAYLYDELMKEAPYEKWTQLVIDSSSKYGVQGKKLLDLACGTGELSVRLSKAGFQVTGVDLSDDMLTVAANKAERNGEKLEFYQQNMAELEGPEQFNLIGIFCDSLNYLQTEKEVIDTFRSVHHHLEDDGLFIFDVHSIYKMMNVFVNQTFTLNDDEISYIWEAFEGEEPYSVWHDLSFFVLDKHTGKYDRYDEQHFQRTFPVEIYKAWLIEAGFEILEVTADFMHHTLQSDSERIFFTCRKQQASLS